MFNVLYDVILPVERMVKVFSTNETCVVDFIKDVIDLCYSYNYIVIVIDLHYRLALVPLEPRGRAPRLAVLHNDYHGLFFSEYFQLISDI